VVSFFTAILNTIAMQIYTKSFEVTPNDKKQFHWDLCLEIWRNEKIMYEE